MDNLPYGQFQTALHQPSASTLAWQSHMISITDDYHAGKSPLYSFMSHDCCCIGRNRQAQTTNTPTCKPCIIWYNTCAHSSHTGVHHMVQRERELDITSIQSQMSRHKVIINLVCWGENASCVLCSRLALL